MNQELLGKRLNFSFTLLFSELARRRRGSKKEKKYRKALEKISELRPSVDFFFEKVLVMVEDEEVRRNRIALLGRLLKEFSTIADFSELGSEEGEISIRQ